MKISKLDNPHKRTVEFAIFNSDNNIYSFKEKRFMQHEAYSEPNSECVLELPYEMYYLLAQKIQEDNSIPDKKKEYIQGKLEATEKHLEDMRKLVLKGK